MILRNINKTLWRTRIVTIILCCLILYSCKGKINSAQEESYAYAGEDMTTYVGSYVLLDPSGSRINEDIQIIDWIQDADNPEEVVVFAHSTLQELNVVSFEKMGVYKFVLQITCESGNVFTDSVFVTVRPRQSGLINDILLEIHIRYRIKYQEGELSEDILSELDSLSTSNIGYKNKIQSIEGIEYCNNLVYLNLCLQGITDLQPIANLVKLEYLDLNQNYTIVDISPIYNLTNLKFLSLYCNPIEDISGLGRLTKLKELWLLGTNINDISSLSYLRDLEILYADGVGTGVNFDSIAPLKNLKKLTHLDIAGRGITDIENLEDLTELVLLGVSYNDLTEISAVSKMKKLIRLYIRRNQVNDISGIKNLGNLDFLDAADNQIKDISELQYLENIHLIGLDGNNVEDILPLVNNFSLGTGVYLYLTENLLNETSINEYIPALVQRGVLVYY